MPWILRAWWKRRDLRLLVVLLILAGVVDVAYSWMFMMAMGPTGELNPAIRYFYREGLVPVWLVVNVFASLFGSVILGSLVTSSNFRMREAASTGLSFLLGLRFTTTNLALANYYLVPWLGWSVVFAGCTIFVAIRKYLIKGYIIRMQALRWVAADWFYALNDLVTSVALSFANLGKPSLHNSGTEVERTVSKSLSPQDKKRLFCNVLTLIVVTSLLLGLLSVLQDVVFKATPWWIRELGIVTEIQARAFLVAFVAIFAGMTVLFYVLSSVFEIVSRPGDD
ncbi:MAG: hypothetical protein ABSF09_02980 [Candidatus Bathyarchaeia archaeon]